MASAAQNIGTDGGEFTVDATPQVWTIMSPGRWAVRNTHASQEAAIMINGTLTVPTAPLGAGGLRLVAGAVVLLPYTCSSIGVVATGAGQLQIERSVG